MQLGISMKVRCGNFLAQNYHQEDRRDDNPPASKGEQVVEDDQHVCCHIHHVIERLDNLTIENIHVSGENVEDLSNRGDIEEDVDWSEEDLSESLLVDISSNTLFHLREEDVAKISTCQAKDSNECECFHIL